MKDKIKHYARAPYNFIPLNDVLVESEFQQPEQIPSFNKYYERNEENNKLFTGKIVFELETVTPLYIRGVKKEIDREKKVSPDFFAPGGRVKIPGSSIRGMIRNLLEIVSWGKFENFEDKVLYYRGLADMSNLREEYQNNMVVYDDKAKKVSDFKFNAGFLCKKGITYYIIPAQKENGRQCVQIKRGKTGGQFYTEKRSDGKYRVVSGKMQGKKRDWLVNAPDLKAERIEIPEADIIAYKNDVSRYQDKWVYDKNDAREDKKQKKDGDLLRMLEVSESGIVPCFYVIWRDSKKQQRVSFGHTGYFRLAYKHSIGEHVPGLQEEVIDLPQAIFGDKEKFASRVSFEDVFLAEDQDNVFLDANYPQILAAPKPTTFQHYLSQPDGEKTHPKALNHWNSKPSESSIRGYKCYWHRDTRDKKSRYYWVEQGQIRDKLQAKIQPVRPGVKFKGSIRFMNLSSVELGALLFVLCLPENHYHKLGMGKPLGLGTVKITSQLLLSDRIKRYTNLFEGSAWQIAEKSAAHDEYIKCFEKYVLSTLHKQGSKDAGVKGLWETVRLKHLKTMLDWQNTKRNNWLEHTRYMEIQKERENEYKKRPVLPEPCKVATLLHQDKTSD